MPETPIPPATSDDSPADEPRPSAGSDAASAPARSGFTLRGRKWVYGATLAAAGVLAGSGVTYAVVGTPSTVQAQTTQQDGSGAGARGPREGWGGPADGQAPGTQPSSAPSASTGEPA